MERGGWIILLLVLLLLTVAALWSYNYIFHPVPPPIASASYVQADQEADVLVIDMNADAKVNFSEILSGNDAVLLIHQSDDPADHSKDNYYANNFILAVFDKNHDGRIDANDAIYSKLELKFFDPSHKNMTPGYVPIARAGIRAIYIDPKYYGKEAVLSEDRLPKPVGTVILSDNSARLIRQVRLNVRYLNFDLPPTAATTQPQTQTAPTQPLPPVQTRPIR